MSIEADIADALAVHAETVAATLGLSISMPNVPFTPPDVAMYLEVRHFRNTNLNPTWGEDRVLLGIYQISVIDPNQAGEIPATAIASQVIDAFHKNTLLYSGAACVMVYENPTLLTTVQLANKSAYPVSIPYRCSEA
jgi:ABC-type tungstate transport system permease subunit